VTTDAIVFAVERGWVVVQGGHSICLTDTGRRLVEATLAQNDDTLVPTPLTTTSSGSRSAGPSRVGYPLRDIERIRQPAASPHGSTSAAGPRRRHFTGPSLVISRSGRRPIASRRGCTRPRCASSLISPYATAHSAEAPKKPAKD